MKLTKITLALGTLALGIASAASSYSLNVTSEVRAGDTQLKAGTYKVHIDGDKAIFKQGKTTVSVPVTVQQNATRYRYTEMEADNSVLQAIDLGGTSTKLVFSSSKSGNAVAAAH